MKKVCNKKKHCLDLKATTATELTLTSCVDCCKTVLLNIIT